MSLSQREGTGEGGEVRSSSTGRNRLALKKRPLEDVELENIKRALLDGLRGHGFSAIRGYDFPVPGFTYGFRRNEGEPIVGVVECGSEVRVFCASPYPPKAASGVALNRYLRLYYDEPRRPSTYTRSHLVFKDREDAKDAIEIILTMHRHMISDLPRSDLGPSGAPLYPSRHMGTVMAELEHEKVVRLWPIVAKVRKRCAIIGAALGTLGVFGGAEEQIPHYVAEKSVELSMPSPVTDLLMTIDMQYRKIPEYKKQHWATRGLLAFAIGGLSGGILGIGVGQLLGRRKAGQRREEIHGKVEKRHVSRLYR